MLVPVLRAREDMGSASQKQTFIVIAVIIIAGFVILITTYLLKAKLRARRASSASTSDKPASLFSWKNFRKRPRRHDYSTSLQDTEYRGNSVAENREMSGAADPERQNSSTGRVDRNTSVRSVMTLPAYTPAAREDERILGREGERAGMDNVVELPETLDDEEMRREQEMESLYQIRLARRVEAADREARRQARREARQRGDSQTLADIRRRAEEAADLSVSQLLIAEHQNANRDRRVSSVAYGDLGVARHDGTRLRANSSESDNRPLLDSAASMSGQSGHSRSHTNTTLDTHHRGLSVTSVSHSIDSRASSEFEFPEAVRTRSQSNNGFEVVSLDQERNRSGSRGPSPTVEIPREQAPAYEHPPNYESPLETGAPQLPRLNLDLEPLPSIQVTTDPTPVDRPSQSSLWRPASTY
ncbi:hypothetical protein P153DRAFT_364498 [Dothidotthia symphoricarpi CBS 119687]|uniref:Uncharacterized protein n=1 Tax=Dothidotthia symphoricarpi CBS 119687 TaxID=1392245 RepID=A0A6A6ANI2_9PLEO|nr:uncharacterized protein P153DRAFT_364498 [Dothidotthia symphoricarpi CBS 119687]KAF2132051.1 hypothetical protein P153DRAFT_364498 [Dothidotthia symphoricarpi CBS 119687]